MITQFTLRILSKIILTSLVLSVPIILSAVPRQIDIATKASGVELLTDYQGRPDAQGVTNHFILKTPDFSRGVYYRGEWWPYAGNRVTSRHITRPVGEEGGCFLLLELNAGGYLAVLPLSGDRAYSWFAPDGEDFILKLGTHGTDSISGDQPLLAWARGGTPYEACATTWKLASQTPQIKGYMKLREDKPYPDAFRYLGWCSWEEYKKNIDTELLVNQLKGLRESPVPIRYFLVDDGHFELGSIAPKLDTFPKGYRPLTDQRTKDGISWIGMWYALLGNARAIEAPGDLGILSEKMMRTANGRIVPKPDPDSIESFLRYMFDFSKRDDIDFLKVDFYGSLLPLYAGTLEQKTAADFPPTTINAIGNPAAATVTYARVLQSIVEQQFDGLINCNWHQPQFLFNSGNSSVGRCSADYKVGNLVKAKTHLYDSYAAILWLGQTAWGDHDMFHSNDPFAGRMMAISKALSGAPVYLSDPYEHLDAGNIMPLCYEDGLLLRPLAPAAPLTEDIFQPMGAERLHRVIAPLANHSAALAIYNFHGDAKQDKPTYSTTIEGKDYLSARGLLQPKSKDWKETTEGLVVFDWNHQSASKLKSGYEVSIEGFGDRLLQLSPINNGWSVIGRIDKYLPSAAVDSVKANARQIKVKLHESGPLGIWLSHGKPSAKGISFTDQGNGFYIADIPIEAKSTSIVIRRK